MSSEIIEIGKINRLRVLKWRDQGIYVGDDVEEILLPTKWIPEGVDLDDEIDVFVYVDSEDRLIATTMTPKITRDTFAYMRVKDVSSIGAFLDWGLEKDLLVPFKEQQQRMNKGEWHLVYMYLDDVTDRLVASSHINRFLAKEVDLEEGQEVEILLGNPGELGYTAIINGKYKGMVYKNQVYKNVKPGDVTTAYIHKIREDQKIDLVLEPVGIQSIEPNSKKVLEILKNLGGFSALGDKSEPDEIQAVFQMSKKNFKKACGSLYKNRMIRIEENGIYLIKK